MTKELEIKIGEKIKELRKKHKFSQEDLAERLGVTRQSIISLEQDKYLPSLPLVISMCDVFETAFDQIFAFGEELHQVFDNQGLINHSDEKIGVQKEVIMTDGISPWRPFRESVSLRDAMDRLFEDSVITPKSGGVMPKIDIKETTDSVIVKAELPGISEDDVDVEILDNVMTISGEKKSEEEKLDEGYYYKESHSGSFARSFTLPADVKAEKADADMKDGVLTITVPKIEPKKAKKIAIKPKK
ncbi:MAG: Hsp20 family protein [Candidatus Berkelbacteria bacterium]|nr:Hsp20 family protein [Candidatus Berkelbacteria bacterium]